LEEQMNDAVNRVVIGMDPHKRSVTIEVMMRTRPSSVVAGSAPTRPVSPR
jgi:hypothetical protein